MSKRTYPVPNKNLSGSDYIQNRRAKELFSGTSNLAKTIEEQNGNFPLLTPAGRLKPYQGTYGLSGRSTESDKTYCLNTSHSYRDLLAITKGKYLLTPPNISFESQIQLKDVSNAQKLYNGLYYTYTYNTTNALAYMSPAYPTSPGSYIPNRIEYNPSTDANQRIITDPSYVISYSSQSCVLNPVVSRGIKINNSYASRYSFNRTINLDLLAGFQYPSKFSLNYESGDCINANNDVQDKYALLSPPVNIIPPVLTGSSTIGSTLTCSEGTWSGFPYPTFTYQWFRVSSPIPGENTYTYVLQAVDAGLSITCQVTGTNDSGSAIAISNIVTPTTPPVNTGSPVISVNGGGAAKLNSMLSCTTGTWSGYPTPSYTYQWFRGATLVSSAGSTYIIVSLDGGQKITCHVKASNVAGNSTAISNEIIVAPVNSVAPVISVSGGGNAKVGSTLSTTNGTWISTPNVVTSYSYQWYNSSGLISLATSSTYTIVTLDAGQSVTCQVTAINIGGSSNPATSNAIIVAPYNTIAPVISVVGGGSPSIGSTLSSDTGTWTSAPSAITSYTYKWYRDATLISSAGNTYITVTADAGKSITCQVTAVNGGGSSNPATSNIIIPGVIPVNTSAPVIASFSGSTQAPTTFYVSSDGTWSGTTPISYTYQWYQGINPVSGYTGSSFPVVTSMIGSTISCYVTASNTGGSSIPKESNTLIPTA